VRVIHTVIESTRSETFGICIEELQTSGGRKLKVRLLQCDGMMTSWKRHDNGLKAN